MKQILSVAAALAFVCCAQETVHLASVSGRVIDASGAIIEGARVTARQTGTNVTVSAVTGKDGRFRLPYLRVGPYALVVRQVGFTDSTREVTLAAGGAYELSITMSIGPAETNVQVVADGDTIEAARSQIAGRVSERDLSALPLNGRNFLDVALLIPGVSPTNTGSNQLFAETSAVPGQGISIGSQRNFSNNFIVDGLSANDDAAGLSGMLYGVDTVQEFQVVTSGGQAELGRALGGFVNVVTRSGTNTVRGDLYGYFRNQRWNAANPLSNTKLPMTQAQYGASLGGPLKTDRTFYFANFERRDLNQSGLVTISPANVAAINSRLDAVGFTGQRIATGIYPNPVHLESLLGKVDHQVNARDQFSLRYSLYRSDSRNSRGAGALNAATASAGLDNTDQTIAFGNILTLSSRTVNETRGQFAYSDLLAEPSDPAGPSVNIAGVAAFGRLSGSPTGRRNRMYELINNLSHQAGSHALRVGGSFLYNDTFITYPRSVRGAYSFSSLANFMSGVYNNAGFTQTFGAISTAQANPNAGFYVQDEWKVRPSLTFNLGLRYDLQFLESIRTDRNNFSPRAGFAWTPFASRNTVIRGGAGLFYDRVPLRALANALLSSANTTQVNSASQISVSLAPAQAGAPLFPGIMPAGSIPSGVLANFTTMQRDLQNAYSTQFNVEVEQRMGGKNVLSVGYQRLRGLHLIASINQNVPACVAAGINNGCRPNPNYANNSQYQSAGDSVYNGLHVSFQRRPSRWGAYRISYTYSKAMNDVGEFFFSGPIDPYNIWRDWGRSDDDQRHRVVFHGTLAWRGFQWNSMLQYYSSLPLNVTTGATTVQGTSARPLVNGQFLERNAGTGNDFFGINTRLSREFRITERLRVEAMAEAFNALNHRNNLARNGVWGAGAYPSAPAATFGQVTAVQDPRSLQLALRIRF